MTFARWIGVGVVLISGTYMFEGRQYVVVAIGGSEPGSAQFVALIL